MTLQVEPTRRLTYDQLGPRLRELRKREHLTVRRAARRAGISRSAWSATECGVSTPTTATAERMCAALGCTLAEVLDPPIPEAARPALEWLADEIRVALEADPDREAEVERRSRSGEGIFLTPAEDGKAAVIRIGPHPDRLEASLAIAAVTPPERTA